MKPKKANSTKLKELRLKLGIRSPGQTSEFEIRAARYLEAVQHAARYKKGHAKPKHRWTSEDDKTLMDLRASRLDWVVIAKHLHRTPRAVKNRLSKLLAECESQ